MLTSVELHNFQSHADTTLELHPGVNVLVGPSNSGKTAIIRALRWLRFNRPLGTAYVRSGQRGCAVAASTAAGRVIRERSANKNCYVVQADGRSDSFAAVGSAVPDAVGEFLPFGATAFQEQLDPPFLVLDPPAEAAKKLDAAARLAVLAGAIRWLDSERRSADAEAARLRSESTAVQEKLKATERVEEAAKALDDAEAVEESLERAALAAGALEGDCAGIESCQSELRVVRRTASLQRPLAEAQELLDTAADARRAARVLSEVLFEIGTCSGLTEGFVKVISLKDSASEAEDRAEAIAGTSAAARTLELLLDKVGAAEYDLAESRKAYESAMRSFASEVRRLKVCPFCGRAIGPEDEDFVIRHLEKEVAS